jgi:hypothetical protein
MAYKEGQNAIIEHLRGHQGVLAIVELGKRHFRVRINEGLLVNSTNSFNGADVGGVLGP